MELLEFFEITDSLTFKQWCRLNHPDKGGDLNKFILVREAYEKHIQNNTPKEVCFDQLWENIIKTVKTPNIRRECCIVMVENKNYDPRNMLEWHKNLQCRKHKIRDTNFCKEHSELIPEDKLKPGVFPVHEGSIYCEKLLKEVYYGVVGYPNEFKQCKKKKKTGTKYCHLHQEKDHINILTQDTCNISL
jgi:hypothetical protein